MKLYVWEEVLYDIESGYGRMIAIANSVEEARITLKTECQPIPDDELALTPKEYELDTPRAFACWGGAV